MTKKLYEFAHIHQPTLFASEDVARGVEKKLDALDAIHRTALVSVTSTRESNELTAKGKQSALEELQAEVVKKVRDWQKANQHYSDYASQLVQEMKPKRHSRDDIVWELQQREIRDHFRTLDRIEQEAVYRAAAAEGNDQFLEAIEHSPLPFKFSMAYSTQPSSHFSSELTISRGRVLGNPGWSRDSQFATLASRLAHQDRLDDLISQWTCQRTAEVVMEQLQEFGVAAWTRY